MSKPAVFTIFCLVCATVQAREETSVGALNPGRATAFQDKTLSVVRHLAPVPRVRSWGDAFFSRNGFPYSDQAAAARASSVDPTDIFEQELVPVLATRFGLKWGPESVRVIERSDPASIAAAARTDYVLDLRTRSWQVEAKEFAQSRSWVGYTVDVVLYEVQSVEPLARMRCYRDTNDVAVAPKISELMANEGELFNAVSRHLAWKCLKLAAGEVFGLPADSIPPIPAAYLDPLADYAKTQPPPAPGHTNKKKRGAGF